jgi:hypothetical protein
MPLGTIGSGRYTIEPIDIDAPLATGRRVSVFVLSRFVSERFYSCRSVCRARSFYRQLAEEAVLVQTFDPFEEGAGASSTSTRSTLRSSHAISATRSDDSDQLRRATPTSRSALRLLAKFAAVQSFGI